MDLHFSNGSFSEESSACFLLFLENGVELEIDHVRYIKFLTCFRDKITHLSSFSCVSIPKETWMQRKQHSKYRSNKRHNLYSKFLAKIKSSSLKGNL